MDQDFSPPLKGPGYEASAYQVQKWTYFQKVKLHIDNKIVITYGYRTKNYNRISDLCQFSVLLGL